MSIRWSYGITTCPKRRDTLLPDTLASLEAAGFPKPRLFVDGLPPADADVWERGFRLEVTARWPLVRVYANWVMALQELYLREPMADRYAVFQDDLLAVRNLRAYLDACPLLGDEGQRGYLNLYTTEGNRALSVRANRDGWFRSNQLGKGALGLVFDNRGVRELLASRLMVDRPRFPYDGHGIDRGWRFLDGAVSEALCRGEQRERREAYTEWCHRPSLVQHTGVESVMDKRKWLDETKADGERVPVVEHDPEHPTYRWGPETFTNDWRGVDFDPLAIT